MYVSEAPEVALFALAPELDFHKVLFSFILSARARARARRPGERGHASGWRRSPAYAFGKGGDRGMSAARTFDFVFVSSISLAKTGRIKW